ncbi:MAG TPA: phosphoglucosamine mutase, partial [Epsilonproteobacteria bacterium]|nr:phosphoglucosamine mutase [Campylobacterota bacterium]
KHGLKLYRSDVGDKNVVSLMQEKGLNFGGEQSGHIIFSDYAKTGDGISSALQALAHLVKTGKKASEVFSPYDAYPQKLVNILISEKRDFDAIEGLDDNKSEVEAAGMRQLFRYSGTENKLRILLEGKDAVGLDQMMEKCVSFFRRELV